MVRLRSVDVVLLVLCALLGVATVYNQSFCALILSWGPNRAIECTSDRTCYTFNGLCENSSGQMVQFASFGDFELDYHVCRSAPQTCYKCRVLDTRSACLVRYFFLEPFCSGRVVCTSVLQQVNDCETDFSGCGG
ncbi:MAG: hypothetical protein KatS3mg110_3762 [Pirellulaceae bacterium]|nr:MAG: hypothetical protein KatS3mg110_3762 [Pirellulaceae bacterium]